MTSIVFEGARIFDGQNEHCAERMSVLVEDGIIREISAKKIAAAEAQRIDVGGRTLMPGLIDMHFHAYASDTHIQKIDAAGEAYRTAHATRALGHALDCGFTTVRDVGGGDYSLWHAIQDGLIRAPRFFYAGHFLTMTGGHGDHRHPNQLEQTHGYCACGSFNAFGVIVDGVEECVKAAREQFRRGAHCIKIIGSGGVLSPSVPIWLSQYREAEIRAIVGEAEARHSYVTAHCHPASAIRRCVEFGVRGIEHGTLIDDDTAEFVAEKGAYIVPTIVAIHAIVELGEKLGLPSQTRAKAADVFEKALTGLQTMRRTGVKIAFGTDLIGETYVQQCREFTLRSEVFSSIEILRQATSMGAEVLMQTAKLGCIAEDAHADMIVVDGDPLKDISLLAQDGRKVQLVMRGGKIVKNELGRAHAITS